ncbi:MAG: glycine--tRNA ligase [Candidatus Micrarchaeota archaeon]
MIEMNPAPLHERLYEIALKRGFLIPSNELYGSVGGFFDYGPVGCLIKRKIENSWRDFFLKREGFFEVETSTILPEVVLRASGHIKHFADPLVECEGCGRRFRADTLIKEKTGKDAEGAKPEDLNKLIKENKITCPECGKNLSGVAPFNLMFKTSIGVGNENTAYTRPETAQGIFMDFARVFRSFGSKLPIGIGQIGKSYRNEISPRNVLMRMREFSQMEIEYFFNPKSTRMGRFDEVKNQKIRIYTREEQVARSENASELTAGEAVERGIVPNEILAYFIARETQFYQMMGIPYNNLRFRHLLPEETPHYSGGNFDLEVHTSFGWIETIGNAYRTDYDLRSHAETSKQDLSVFLEEEKAKILPHVVEPSFGVDRLFWCMLESCYRKEGGAEGRSWEWFDFPAGIAPFECGVFPLMKKDGLAEKARALADKLRAEGFDVIYDESGSIGKRYARADEIGVPYCITIDYDSLKNEDATIRFRNDGKQARAPLAELGDRLRAHVKENKTRM